MQTTIGQLFHIEYGQKEYENKRPLEGEDGDNILISSKGEDNGVYGFFNIKNNYKAPFITVPRVGTIGKAFVQEYDCSVDNNCLVLKPLKPMKLNELYSVAYQIRKSAWKYKYGRQITPTRLQKQKVIKIKPTNRLRQYKNKITPPQTSKKTPVHPNETAVFKLKDWFKVIRGKGSYLEKIDKGNTPVVSTQMLDNGVCGFFDIEPTFKKHCITVGRIMCNPRVQLYDFATVPDDMYVLLPHQTCTKEFLFYISSIIKTEGWRFNYSRKVTKEKLENLSICLPVKSKKIDYTYINMVAKSSYGYGSL